MNALLVDTLIAPWRRRRILGSAAARSRPDVRFMELPDCTIRYREAGTLGPCIVLCADPPVPLEVYDALIERLARDYRVIVFELPAFGFSLPRASLQLNLPAASATVERFLRQLDRGPYLLAFSCVPAYVALWIAARTPELVSGLVVIQAPHWSEELLWKARRDPRGILARPWLGQVLLKLLRRRRAGAWYRLAVGQRQFVAPFTAETEHAFAHGACFSLASAFQQFLVAEAPAIAPPSQPALVVWGGADRSHADTDKDSIRRHLPQARIVHFDSAGHFPELEAPDRFVDALRDMFPPPNGASGTRESG
ncbi:MAG: alpha/beta hydrolase [Sinimarinibacterium sp.]|jgi:pimeloyl-ACP methyl ester carboxylesterase